MEQSSATLTAETLSVFDTTNLMTGWQDQSLNEFGGRLYMMLANGSTDRFHTNQMRLISTQLTVDDFTAFADAFNLPVQRPQVANGETLHLDEHAVDHNQQTSNQGTPAEDEIKPEESSKSLLETRRFKRGHIPKKQFELNPRRKTYKYP